MLRFNQYEVLSFDCYGTLIDWESGMLAALGPVLAGHNIPLNDREVLEQFAAFEPEQQQGEYIKYREVLRRVVQQFGDRLGFVPSPTELNSLADSLPHWPPFPDTVEALKTLKQHFKLAIISNIDDDLFAATAKQLQVEFDWIITAEQVKSYKPSPNNFRQAIARIGIAPDKILHIAASLYHDIAPANALGLPSVWVNRRAGQAGSGAALPTQAQPDLEVPDLRTLVNLILK